MSPLKPPQLVTPPPVIVPAPLPAPPQDQQSSVGGGGSTSTQDALLPAVPAVDAPANDTSPSYDDDNEQEDATSSDAETDEESPAANDSAEPASSSSSVQSVTSSSTQPSLLTGTAPVQAPKEAAAGVNAAGGRGVGLQLMVAMLTGVLAVLAAAG